MARGRKGKAQEEAAAELGTSGATTGYEAELWQMADPDSLFLPLDIVVLLFGILSNHYPKKSWGGGLESRDGRPSKSSTLVIIQKLSGQFRQ